MKYKPEDGTWIVSQEATGLEEIRNELGAEEYDKQKQALQKFLCDYFSAGDCVSKQGKSISPVSGAPKGGAIMGRVMRTRPGS